LNLKSIKIRIIIIHSRIMEKEITKLMKVILETRRRIVSWGKARMISFPLEI